MMIAGLAALLLAHCTSGANSSEKALSHVKIFQAVCGALLRDDFNGGQINQCFWRRWLTDPGIHVEIQNGELCIRGTSEQIPDNVLRKDPVMLWRYVGITSIPITQVDVSLAVRVKAVSGISEEPGLHAVSVHLCGVAPDTYPEVLFGKLGGKDTQELIHKYVPGIADDVRYPDVRGWFLAVINQDKGDNEYLVSGTPLPEQGDERRSFHDVLLDYNEQTSLSRAVVKLGGHWVQLGKPERLVHALTVVELKIMDVTPLYGAAREARFDDCRLYPNASHNPMKLVVITQPYNLRYRGPRLRVALYTDDGAHKVSEGFTDQDGTVKLPVDTPSWVVFPVSAQLRIFRGETEVARSSIEAHEVDGLYPGDVWVLDSSQIPGPPSRDN